MDGVTAAGVRGVARVRARADGRDGTCLPELEGAGPPALRRTRGSGTEAHVLLVGAMSGPLAGDRLMVRADVRPGARLRVASAAATPYPVAWSGRLAGRRFGDVDRAVSGCQARVPCGVMAISARSPSPMVRSGSPPNRAVWAAKPCTTAIMVRAMASVSASAGSRPAVR